MPWYFYLSLFLFGLTVVLGLVILLSWARRKHAAHAAPEEPPQREPHGEEPYREAPPQGYPLQFGLAAAWGLISLFSWFRKRKQAGKEVPHEAPPNGNHPPQGHYPPRGHYPPPGYYPPHHRRKSHGCLIAVIVFFLLLLALLLLIPLCVLILFLLGVIKVA
ncbi:MAG: hypothetical protein FWD39_04020 [Clostridiales bacterium]|nr:hypothetical protein [Clostridiales bacterium]